MAVPERLALVETATASRPDLTTAAGERASLGPDLHFGGGGRAAAQFHINSDAGVTDHFNSDRLLATLSMVRHRPDPGLSWNARAGRGLRRRPGGPRPPPLQAFVGYRQHAAPGFPGRPGYAADYKDGEDRSNPLLRGAG